MQDVIEEIISCRWFSGENAPFACDFTLQNPNLILITGPNASGKSLLRKILHGRVNKKDMIYVNTSQQGRCTGGIERAFIYGSEAEESTGFNSIKQIKKCFNSIKQYEKPCVVMLDEPEIGCSEEVQAAMGIRIADELSRIEDIPMLQCFFIITHSRQLVKYISSANPSHWRLSGDNMTLEQFVNREIAPADLDKITEESNEKWRAVAKMIEER